jgi:hypothetical protein
MPLSFAAMEMKMANENPQPAQKRLTLDDPVGKEALDKLAELEQAEVNAAMQLLALEQEKVKLLAVGRRVDDERHKVFEKLLMERGLAPNAPATIDATTGKISLVKVPGPQAQPAPTPPPPNGQS